MAKTAVLELVDSPKLISRKLRRTEKSWNFHIVNSQLDRLARSVVKDWYSAMSKSDSIMYTKHQNFWLFTKFGYLSVFAKTSLLSKTETNGKVIWMSEFPQQRKRNLKWFELVCLTFSELWWNIIKSGICSIYKLSSSLLCNILLKITFSLTFEKYSKYDLLHNTKKYQESLAYKF